MTTNDNGESVITNLKNAIVSKVTSLISTHNSDTNSHSDIRNSIPSPSTSNPLADTTSGSVGNSATYAKANHTHPKSDLYNVTVEKQQTAETGFVATYVIKQNNTQVGSKINIPKDFLVKSATMQNCVTANSPLNGLNVGDPYLDFIVNTIDDDETDNHIYINVSDLVSDSRYTASTGLTLTNNAFSVHYGTTVGTACEGNDSRLTDTRNPIMNHIGASSSAIKDLDNYTTAGFYYCKHDTNEAPYVDNQPLTTNRRSFFLLVEAWDSIYYIKQTLTYYNTGDTYIRTKKGNTAGWNNWYKLSFDSHTHDLNDINIETLGANANFDDYKTQALMKISYADAQSSTNMPVKFGGLLIVKDIYNGVSQTFQQYGGSTTNIWYRTYYASDSSWSTWQKISVDGHTHKETELTWDGSTTNGLPALSQASIDEFSANRLAYFPPANISIRYSTDNGSTYADYGADIAQKANLVNKNYDFYLGKGSTTDYSKNRLIIDLNMGNLNADSVLYCNPQKLLIEMGTMGATGCKVAVHVLTYSNEWVGIGTYNLGGWTGWNAIPLTKVLGGYASQTTSSSTNGKMIRLTFTQTGGTANSKICGLRLIAPKLYKYPSNMSLRGHLYDYDYQQNAIFPAKIIKSGGTSAQFLKADGSVETLNTTACTVTYTDGSTGTINLVTR